MKSLPTAVRVKSSHLHINYTHAGERFFEATGLSATAANVIAAKKLRDAKLQALKYGIEPDEIADEFRTGTFAGIAQEFLDALELKPSTKKSYRQLLQIYWMPYLQHRQIGAIELPRLRKIVRDTEWTSRKVMKNAVSVLRQVFQFAIDDGYIESNPAQRLTIKRKKSEAKDPDPYTIEERDALLEWLEANTAADTHAYFMTGFHTGMRTGELLALTWADYDGESLSVDKARVQGEMTTTKTGESRTVLIPATLANVLNQLPSRFKKDHIFTNQYGRKYQAGYHLNKKFREAHEKTGVRHRGGPYPWRHTYASIGLSRGAKPAWMAKQLGHSLQMFYSTYAKWLETDADKTELEKLA